MRSLSAFEEALRAAIKGDAAVLAPWLAGHSDGLSVYRNTVMKGAVDALAATYSTVVQMVGETWFRAAAREYATAHPPTEPSLMRYGAGLPDWLSAFPPAQDTPWLGLVAQIDQMWWEAYFAADAGVLGPNALAELTTNDLETTGVVLNPAMRLARFGQTLASLWLVHQGPRPPEGDLAIEDRPERLLIWRAGQEVKTDLIGPATHAFLATLGDGGSLMAAAEAAFSTEPDAALPDIMAQCVARGLFVGLTSADRG
ncbi:MAG: DUF2063 domain-containing protein [Alphaproteobacteria bacterium]|nr:DUF2063 domain-containing protein [Alphaproteobacteria bacterium]